LNLCVAKTGFFQKNPVFLYTSDHKIKVGKAAVHDQFIFCIIEITVSDYADANPTYADYPKFNVVM